MQDSNVRTAEIEFYTAVISTFGGARKAMLNSCEKAIYEGALKKAARLALPAKQARTVVTAYEGELAEQRQRAEAARLARQQAKGGGAESERTGTVVVPDRVPVGPAISA